MNTRTTLFLSLALGLVACALVWTRRPRAEETDRKPRGVAPETVAMREKLERTERALEAERTRRETAEKEVERLRAPEQPPLAQPDSDDVPEIAPLAVEEGPPSDAELGEELRNFGASLREIIVGSADSKDVVEHLRSVLARCTPEQIQTMVKRSGSDTEDIGARFVLSHALAQSHIPEAIEVLRARLRDPEGTMVEQRVSSHALAFCDLEGMPEFLVDIARNTKDRGVRANSAFGAARIGLDEGVDLYLAATDEAFEAGDPEAMQYLGGFGLLGNKVMPGLRERLLTYDVPQAVLVMIEIVKGRGDRDSLPQLEKLAYDASRPAAVQKAARGAIEVLQRPVKDS